MLNHSWIDSLLSWHEIEQIYRQTHYRSIYAQDIMTIDNSFVLDVLILSQECHCLYGKGGGGGNILERRLLREIYHDLWNFDLDEMPSFQFTSPHYIFNTKHTESVWWIFIALLDNEIYHSLSCLLCLLLLTRRILHSVLLCFYRGI